MKILPVAFYFIIVIIMLYLACASAAPVAHAANNVTTGYIWGRALMPDGATGISGCEVKLLYAGDQLMAKTISDADGNFVFTNLQPNDDTWSYRLVVTDGNWGQSVTPQFSVMADAATVADVYIFPTIGTMSFAGSRQSVDADGRSVVDMTVALADVNGRPVPDGLNVKLTQLSYFPNPGRFIAGKANATEMTLATSGGRIAFQYGAVPADALARSVQITAACVETSGTRTLNLTIDLVNPNVIQGTVTDATGLPVPYARVFLSRWDGTGRYVGYNSTEYANHTDGSGLCDADGNYRYSVMPAGDYQVEASYSTFKGSGRVTVIRGTYTENITLPLGRGAIKGWVRDNKGNPVPNATISLLRLDSGKLTSMATGASAGDGSFSFDNYWYGQYDIQAVYAGQTADVPLVLGENRTSVTLTLLHDVSVPAISPTAAPGNVTPVPGTHLNATITPRPPTPTPPPVTLSYLATTYGLSLAVMVIVCVAGLFVVLRIMDK